jgi:hypothetical protein
MKKQIIRWILIGLLIRFLIMPFSFIGPDIFFVYYPPFKFIEEGIWDPYLFLKESFPQTIDPYYPPVIFFIGSIFLFIFKAFLPQLGNLFASYESWKYLWQGDTVHFSNALFGHQLFRTLFIFKLPYLIFDLGIAWFLFQMLKSDRKKSLLSLKLWMLNPFVLHNCYALGQVDLANAFFVIAAIYGIYLLSESATQQRRRYLPIVLLSLGVLTKIFPIILVPFAILLIGDTFKERLKLSLALVISLSAVIAPFYLHSKAILEALLFSPSGISSSRRILFMGGYLAILCPFFFIKKKDHIDLDLVVCGFILALLAFYSLYTVTIRYFIVITPLLIYVAVKDKRFWFYNAIFLITLFELRIAGNWEQLTMFSALHPEFFSSLPLTDSFLNLAVNVNYVHQFMYMLFFICSLSMIVHIFVVNRGSFELISLNLRKR